MPQMTINIYFTGRISSEGSSCSLIESRLLIVTIAGAMGAARTPKERGEYKATPLLMCRCRQKL